MFAGTNKDVELMCVAEKTKGFITLYVKQADAL